MVQKPKPALVDEKQVRRLLEKYACPVPYHEVRTRFLGNIATPMMAVSPLPIVKGLWGGELPEFDSLDDVNELIGVLVNGLWNALTRHQKRTDPFRLTRVLLTSNRQNLGDVASIRLQELDGFLEGLFDGKERIDLTQKATAALDNLSDIRAMIAAIQEMAQDQSKPGDATQVEQAFQHLLELTRFVEKEINVVVIECTKARRQTLRGQGFPPRTVH